MIDVSPSNLESGIKLLHGQTSDRFPGARSKIRRFLPIVRQLPAEEMPLFFNDRYLCAWENSPCNTPDDLLWV